MGKTKIMIVEDELIIAMDMRAGLRELQYEICNLFNSGERAIKEIDREIPDIILMDINLDGEMDGIEAVEVIRLRYGIPIIFLTSYCDYEIMKRAKAVCSSGYLIKPVEVDDLSGAIEKALFEQSVVQSPFLKESMA